MGRDDRATMRRDAALGAKAVGKERERRDGSGFIALPFIVTDSPGYRRASHTARSLLVDLARAFTGRNNGSIWLSRSARDAIGWGSESTFRNALADLADCGLVVETRRGGRNLAAWYGLTWRDLDVVAGLDIDPKQWRRGAYLRPDKAPDAGGRAKTAKATAARSIAASLLACYKPAPSDGATPARTAPSHGATDQVPCTVGRCSQADFHDSAAPSHGAYLDGCHLSEQRAACLTSSATAQPAQEDSAAEIRATANLVVVESLNSLMATAQRSAAMRQLGLDPVLGAIAADPSPATWPTDNDGHSMLIRVAPPELTAVSTQESTACPSRFAPFA